MQDVPELSSDESSDDEGRKCHHRCSCPLISCPVIYFFPFYVPINPKLPNYGENYVLHVFNGPV